MADHGIPERAQFDFGEVSVRLADVPQCCAKAANSRKISRIGNLGA